MPIEWLLHRPTACTVYPLPSPPFGFIPSTQFFRRRDADEIASIAKIKFKNWTLRFVGHGGALYSPDHLRPVRFEPAFAQEAVDEGAGGIFDGGAGAGEA